jgi:hypothetical protein
MLSSTDRSIGRDPLTATLIAHDRMTMNLAARDTLTLPPAWPIGTRLLAYALVLVFAFTFAFALPHPAAAVPPDLSEAIVLPGDLEIAPAAGKQWSPEIAAGGSMFLAVWADARASANVLPENLTGGAAFDNENGTMNDIFAARLDAQGRVLDTSPIIVAQQVQNQALPDVAWNGQNWLVVWSGEQGIACCPDINVYAARVSPGGAVLDAPPITIDTDNTGRTGSSSGATWISRQGSSPSMAPGSRPRARSSIPEASDCAATTSTLIPSIPIWPSPMTVICSPGPRTRGT